MPDQVSEERVGPRSIHTVDRGPEFPMVEVWEDSIWLNSYYDRWLLCDALAKMQTALPEIAKSFLQEEEKQNLNIRWRPDDD